MSIQTSLMSGVLPPLLEPRPSLVPDTMLYEVEASTSLSPCLLVPLLMTSSASSLLIPSVALELSAAAINPSPWNRIDTGDLQRCAFSIQNITPLLFHNCKAYNM